MSFIYYVVHNPQTIYEDNIMYPNFKESIFHFILSFISLFYDIFSCTYLSQVNHVSYG